MDDCSVVLMAVMSVVLWMDEKLAVLKVLHLAELMDSQMVEWREK